MPSFSTDIVKTNNGMLRIVVPVLIGDASNVVSLPEQQNRIDIPAKTINGLIDTGATMTCVTSDCAKRLHLTPCGTISIASASHQNIQTNSYRIAVIIAVHGVTPSVIRDGKKENQKVIVPMSAPTIVKAGEFVNTGADDVEVLIGMDVIKHSVMTITGHDNRLTMSF